MRYIRKQYALRGDRCSTACREQNAGVAPGHPPALGAVSGHAAARALAFAIDAHALAFAIDARALAFAIDSLQCKGIQLHGGVPRARYAQGLGANPHQLADACPKIQGGMP